MEAIRQVATADHIVACEPAAAASLVRQAVGTAVDVIAQRGEALGDRLIHVFRDMFRLGYESVVIIGSDLPDLPPAYLQEAVEALANGRDLLVLGPATEGGYYLVGLNQPHDELFQEISWSTSTVLDDTRQRATASGLPTVLLREWSDVDEAEDVQRVLSAPDDVAPRTRTWARMYA
jgi:rSAM/selenodomain-associated transferase 1